jgi:hypothetical protein
MSKSLAYFLISITRKYFNFNAENQDYGYECRNIDTRLKLFNKETRFQIVGRLWVSLTAILRNPIRGLAIETKS